MSECLWLHTFRYPMPLTICFHIAATRDSLALRLLNATPLSCMPALALRLELSKLRVNYYRSLSCINFTTLHGLAGGGLVIVNPETFKRLA